MFYATFLRRPVKEKKGCGLGACNKWSKCFFTWIRNVTKDKKRSATGGWQAEFHFQLMMRKPHCTVPPLPDRRSQWTFIRPAERGFCMQMVRSACEFTHTLARKKKLMNHMPWVEMSMRRLCTKVSMWPVDKRGSGSTSCPILLIKLFNNTTTTKNLLMRSPANK